MIKKDKSNNGQGEIVFIDELIPSDHQLRKIESAIDFTHIYELVEEMYCPDNGRPSVDPVVLIKMVLIQHLYGIPSLRRTAEEVSLNAAYRWFLGYMWSEKTPHFSTISYNFRKRFTSQTIESIFSWILYEIERNGYLSPEAVFIDGTHIKANANIKRKIKKEIPVAAKIYEELLMKEINEDRAVHGKKPFADQNNDDDTAPPKIKTITTSTTDPESGLFVKGEHKKAFAYEAHTACDKHGYIMEVVVTPGNVHDSVAFEPVYAKLKEKHPEMKVIVADSAYKTPWICKQIIDDGKIPSTPYVRPKTKDLGHKWHEYVYDEYNDIIICPEYNTLSYSTTNRDGYREYKSKSYICKNCHTRHMCTENSKYEKTVTKHIWNDYIELAEDYRYTPEIKALYVQRKETIERVFADAKEKHGMRYTLFRGLVQVSNWVRLKFAAMNLKKLANRLWESRLYLDFVCFFVRCQKFAPVFG